MSRNNLEMICPKETLCYNAAGYDEASVQVPSFKLASAHSATPVSPKTKEKPWISRTFYKLESCGGGFHCTLLKFIEIVHFHNFISEYFY
jgi:hypothetical protein